MPFKCKVLKFYIMTFEMNIILLKSCIRKMEISIVKVLGLVAVFATCCMEFVR